METSAIAGMAMNMQAAKLQEAVGVGVMKLQMDTTRNAGQALVEMMNASSAAIEKSVNPHLGNNIDILA